MVEYLQTKLFDWLNYEKEESSHPLCDFERIRYEVRPGDVLLIEGRSRVSEVIKQVTQSPWTHACLYLGRLHDIDDVDIRQMVKQHHQGETNDQLVIEGTLGKGTHVSSINSYRGAHIRICRPKGLTRSDAQIVISTSISQLGSEYNVRQIFDLWRFLVPWSFIPRRWRSSLFTLHDSDNTKTVCSTMIAQAFAKVHFPILPLVRSHEDTGIELIHQNPKLITPKDFDYSPYFEIIKYPFTTFDNKSYYHELPWSPPSSTQAHPSSEQERSLSQLNLNSFTVRRDTIPKASQRLKSWLLQQRGTR